VKLSDQEIYFKTLQSLNLRNPILIGFGIKDKDSFLKACSFANGAIIGTAYIRILENSSSHEISGKTKEFIKSLR
jgi:tryptophan synthase alpha chain